MMAFAALAASVVIQPAMTTAQAASEIAAVVNKVPITSNDVARRTAFLRLQRAKGDLRKLAREQLIDEVLKREEVARVKMSVSTDDVDRSFARFAASNKLSPQQMGDVLNKAGVGVDHFKAFIAVQMSWPRVVNARFSGGRSGRMSNEELVKRMAESGGQKPVTTEYFLQQIIFVVPEAKRKSILNKRMAEAKASRSKFPGCNDSKTFAASMLDVSVKSLGRVMLPELPEDWKPFVEKASGGTTEPRLTERGVEFLAICDQRQVSDDVAAEVVFRAEDLGKAQKTGEDPNDKKYVDELRAKAQISYP
jgi:peptidyl-prolyl cis-trans isomerase SurA